MRLGRLLLVGACLTALAACGGGQATTGDKTVVVTLDEYSLKLDHASIPAGEVTFQVANKGKEEHEFVILRTSLAASALPLNGNQVEEEAAGVEHIDEIDGVAAGGQKNLVVDLKAGSYVLVCNFPDHFHQGMVTSFVVS